MEVFDDHFGKIKIVHHPSEAEAKEDCRKEGNYMAEKFSIHPIRVITETLKDIGRHLRRRRASVNDTQPSVNHHKYAYPLPSALEWSLMSQSEKDSYNNPLGREKGWEPPGGIL